MLFNSEITLQDLVEEIDGLLNDVDRVGFVHGQYYMLASQLYMREGSHAEYYRASLHYLGCTDLDTLSKDDRIEQSFHLSLAALLGKDIFNFGELLAHPILEDLKGTQKVSDEVHGRRTVTLNWSRPVRGPKLLGFSLFIFTEGGVFSWKLGISQLITAHIYVSISGMDCESTSCLQRRRCKKI